MTKLCVIFRVFFSLLLIDRCRGISSSVPLFTNYQHSAELELNVADLWWTVNEIEQEIIFELHVNTTGWIALGISPVGGMKDADIGVGWIDQRGNVHFQDRYSFDFVKPIIDNTTADRFALQGREQNGWTAIQFKRLLDTCDPMDYPIKSGTNILIFAYGLVDPDTSGSNSDISYHNSRRGTRIIPLRSYEQPPPDEKFAELDYFDFRSDNYLLPSTDTTYHCKIYKVPSNYTTTRHTIAHKTLINPGNEDLVHHMLLHECDRSATFDDSNLPSGSCNDIIDQIQACSTKIAIGWTIGGDYTIEYPEEAGYPVGGDSHTKYYMIQIHYDNPKQNSNRRDSSGIRFYLSNERRQYDIGYFVLGTDVSLLSLAIPPRVEQFVVDSCCPAAATSTFPQSGITILSALPHTHLQGQSMWTKLIRNKTAVEYLFNAESYDFNYQFSHRLPKRIQLYPGDELATRCVYNTMNKDEITLGGERTKEEMCFHSFAYYPRMEDLSGCFTANTMESLQSIMNISSSKFDLQDAKQWLIDCKWTPQLTREWQEYYNNAPRVSLLVREGHFVSEPLGLLPKYQDLEPALCIKKPIENATVIPKDNTNTIRCEKIFIVLSFLSIMIRKIFIQ